VKNIGRLIPTIGDDKFINQFGSNGVVLKNIIKKKSPLSFSSTFFANLYISPGLILMIKPFRTLWLRR